MVGSKVVQLDDLTADLSVARKVGSMACCWVARMAGQRAVM